MKPHQIAMLCAEAIELPFQQSAAGEPATWNGKMQIRPRGFFEDYDPRRDDAQCMALIKRFHPEFLWLENGTVGACILVPYGNAGGRSRFIQYGVDLNDALTKCVAAMQAAKVIA